MRLFVTGAGGFIGSSVVRLLVSLGHEVAVLKRMGGSARRLSGLKLHSVTIAEPRRTWSETEVEELRRFDPQVVIHLGWKGVGNDSRNSDIQLENIDITTNLFQAIQSCGVGHFIGVGSQAEYGPCSGAINESQPLAPTTLYGAAKASGYLLTKAMASRAGIEFSWIRVFSTFGPGDEPYWMIQDVTRKLLRNEDVELTPGTQLWDYAYVEDVARAFCAVVLNETGVGAVNVGSGSARSIREIVETLRDLTDSQSDLLFGAVPFREDQVMHLQADISRITSKTGWFPRVGLIEGLTETVNALKANS